MFAIPAQIESVNLTHFQQVAIMISVAESKMDHGDGELLGITAMTMPSLQTLPAIKFVSDDTEDSVSVNA